MTHFNDTLVAKVIGILEKRALSIDDAQRLMALVGSREEFLAHLLLRRGSFARYPALLSAFADAANTACAEQTTQRQEHLDASRRRAAYEQLDQALGTIIGQTNQLHDSFNTADVAMKLFSRLKSSAPDCRASAQPIEIA
jgi:hypothetical protein